MANWDVKYINCFIADAQAKETQVFVSFSDGVRRDVEINMLDYRQNVEMGDGKLFTYAVSFWIVIGLLETVLYISLRTKMRIHISEIEGVEKKKREDDRLFNLWQRGTVLAMRIVFIILVLLLVNKIVMKLNSSHNIQVLSFDVDLKGEGYLGENNNYIRYIQKYGYSEIEVIKLIIGVYYKNVIEFVNLILWLVLTNYALLILLQQRYKSKFYKSKHEFWMREYYFGKSNQGRRELFQSIIVEMVFNVLMIFLIIAAFSNSIAISTALGFINFMIATLISLIVVALRGFLLSRTIRRLENNDDWLLTTEPQ